MRDITSPQAFIDVGFYYMISVALQRRVWLGDAIPNERATFPNMYVLLVAPPGVGKGLVIKPISRALQSVRKVPEALKEVKDQVEGAVVDYGVIAATLLELKQTTTKNEFDAMVFPVGADSTTYQALVQDHAGSIRSLIITDAHGKKRPYMHSSMYFSVEELGNLFRENQTELMNYLLAAYDCGNYRYKTKHQGEDILRNPSLCLLGGTTYDFIREATINRIIDQGLTSRALFIAADKPRAYRFDLGSIDDEQARSYAIIVEHLTKLSKIHGALSFSADALAYLTEYFVVQFPKLIPTVDPRLLHYYARKNQHVRKIAMAMHFSEQTTDMVISLDTAQKALALLDSLEPMMILAFSKRSSNPLQEATDAVLKYLFEANRPMSYGLIWLAISDSIKEEKDLKGILKFLVTTKKITTTNDLYMIVTK
jgi:Protein of unknown function (DUF3987)